MELTTIKRKVINSENMLINQSAACSSPLYFLMQTVTKDLGNRISFYSPMGL